MQGRLFPCPLSNWRILTHASFRSKREDYLQPRKPQGRLWSSSWASGRCKKGTILSALMSTPRKSTDIWASCLEKCSSQLSLPFHAQTQTPISSRPWWQSAVSSSNTTLHPAMLDSTMTQDWPRRLSKKGWVFTISSVKPNSFWRNFAEKAKCFLFSCHQVQNILIDYIKKQLKLGLVWKSSIIQSLRTS